MNATFAGQWQIPKEWEIVSINDVTLDWRGGAPFEPEDFTEQGFPVLHKGAIQKRGQILVDSKKKTYTTEKYAQSHFKSVIDKSYMTVTLRDLVPSGPSIGLIADLANFPIEKYILAQGAYGFQINTERLNPAYLVWLSNYEPFREYLKRYCVGSTQIHIRTPIFQELKIPLPPLEEQRRIAAILDKADAVRRKRQSAIALTEELLRSAFLETMEKWSSKCRAVNLKQTTLSERNSFVNGPFGSNLLTSELQNEGVPVVYIRDIRDGIYRRVSKSYVSQAKARELNTCNVKPGDVLIAKVGDPPGIAAVYPSFESDAIVTQDVIRMRINRKVATPEFIASYINSPIGKHSLKCITVEATRSRFPLGDFKSVIVELPPIEAQEQFSQVVIQARLAQSHIIQKSFIESNLFNSLLQKAFRGEL